MHISGLSNFSLMNHLSYSRCLVQSCWTGLWAMLIVKNCYHNTMLFPSLINPISKKMNLAVKSSQIPCLMTLNLAWALDLATTFHCLLCQVTKFCDRNVQYLLLNLLSNTKLGQLGSVQSSNRILTFPKDKSFPCNGFWIS